MFLKLWLFYDECFVKWISNRTSLSCEVCKCRFKGAYVQLGNIRAYSSISFKIFYLYTYLMPFNCLISWWVLKNFSELVTCVHNEHSSKCGHYYYFRSAIFWINFLISFLIFNTIIVFKKFSDYYGIIIDAPLSRILLTNPHDTYRQNIPEHPDIVENNTPIQSITIHNELC